MYCTSRFQPFHSFFAFVFALILVGISPCAHAQEYYYTLAPGVTETKQLSHRAGQTVFLSAKYNAATERFVWEMSFTASPSTGWLPNGLYFVVNDGFFPKGRQGEMAMLFFDATDLNAPKLTAYAYNGNNAGDSWKYGAFGSNLPPDKIASSLADPSWVNQLKVTDQPGLRTFTIDISVSNINKHSPIYPSLRWFGLKFTDYIGIWAHPIANMSTAYGADGFLTKRTGNEGYVDVARAPTAGCDGVVGGTSQVDVCGICGGNGTSCIPVTPGPNPTCVTGDPLCPEVRTNCESVDIQSVLFTLDSRVAALKNVALSISSRIKRQARNNRSLLRSNKSDEAKAKALYVKGWSTAWSIPTKVISCTGTVTCSNIDPRSRTSTYVQSVTDLSKLIDKFNKRLKKLTGKKSGSFRKSARTKADFTIATIQSEIATLPSVQRLCS